MHLDKRARRKMGREALVVLLEERPCLNSGRLENTPVILRTTRGLLALRAPPLMECPPVF
jgi:hypothetical protein